jgi:diacylglycerol kinase (ATP)
MELSIRPSTVCYLVRLILESFHAAQATDWPMLHIFPKEPEAALQVIFHGKINTVDAFNINHRFSCMLCGLGFDAQVAHDFATQTKRGLTTYAKMTVKNFLRLKRFPFTIKLAQKTFETDACFISIANSNQFGNNFTIAPKASLNDGLLDVVIVTGKNKLSFVIQTLKQLKGWNKLSLKMK